MLADFIAHEAPVEPTPPLPSPPPSPGRLPSEGDPPGVAPPVVEPGATPPVSDPPPGLLNRRARLGRRGGSGNSPSTSSSVSKSKGTRIDIGIGAGAEANAPAAANTESVGGKHDGSAMGINTGAVATIAFPHLNHPRPIDLDAPIPLGRVHARRLRDVYRSAGWPCCDAVEVDLLAAGLLERVRSAHGHETLRVTDCGIAHIAGSLVVNRGAMSAHERLVERVAREMTRSGRIAWRNLSLRAQLPPLYPGGKVRWCIARPDVFSIRNTSVEAYAQPVVHEIKVSRADLKCDLRKPDKRAAYLDLGGECWYVLGTDARGRPIASPDEVPEGCGVLMADGERLTVARAATHRPVQRIPFGVWLALAKAQPVGGFDEDAQPMLVG